MDGVEDTSLVSAHVWGQVGQKALQLNEREQAMKAFLQAALV